MNKRGFLSAGVGILWLFVALLFALASVVLMPLHNYTLHKFSKNLFDVPTPDDSLVLEKRNEIGVLLGNGNHCDYYAGMVIASNLSAEEIEEYYTKVYDGDSKIEHEVITDAETDLTLGVNTDLVEKWSGGQDFSKEYKSLLIIYIFEHSMTGSLDWRCR